MNVKDDTRRLELAELDLLKGRVVYNGKILQRKHLIYLFMASDGRNNGESGSFPRGH